MWVYGLGQRLWTRGFKVNLFVTVTVLGAESKGCDGRSCKGVMRSLRSLPLLCAIHLECSARFVSRMTHVEGDQSLTVPMVLKKVERRTEAVGPVGHMWVCALLGPDVLSEQLQKGPMAAIG